MPRLPPEGRAVRVALGARVRSERPSRTLVCLSSIASGSSRATLRPPAGAALADLLPRPRPFRPPEPQALGTASRGVPPSPAG